MVEHADISNVILYGESIKKIRGIAWQAGFNLSSQASVISFYSQSAAHRRPGYLI